jgi:hypothetical protein
MKHEARRSLDSPGFAWEFSAMKVALFRRSPGEGAIHDVQALGLRMAGPGRPARRGRSVNEWFLHVSRENLAVIRDARMLPCSISAVNPFYN